MMECLETWPPDEIRGASSQSDLTTITVITSSVNTIKTCPLSNGTVGWDILAAATCYRARLLEIWVCLYVTSDRIDS